MCRQCRRQEQSHRYVPRLRSSRVTLIYGLRPLRALSNASIYTRPEFPKMKLMLAATGFAVPDIAWLYFALVQLPIYLLPHLLKPRRNDYRAIVNKLGAWVPFAALLVHSPRVTRTASGGRRCPVRSSLHRRFFRPILPTWAMNSARSKLPVPIGSMST